MKVKEPHEWNFFKDKKWLTPHFEPIAETVENINIHLMSILAYSQLNLLPEDDERIGEEIKFHEDRIQTLMDQSPYPNFIFYQIIQIQKRRLEQEAEIRLKERNKND